MTVRPKEPMKPKVKQNQEFVKWFRDWIQVIRQNRAPVERMRPEKMTSADGQEHSGGGCLIGPKRPVASGRYVS
jgi:hypothetical protein